MDTVLIQEELEQVKDSLQQLLAMMPQDALVGFITFGALCYVHELGFAGLPKAHAFRGTREYSAQQVAHSSASPSAMTRAAQLAAPAPVPGASSLRWQSASSH